LIEVALDILWVVNNEVSEQPMPNTLCEDGSIVVFTSRDAAYTQCPTRLAWAWVQHPVIEGAQANGDANSAHFLLRSAPLASYQGSFMAVDAGLDDVCHDQWGNGVCVVLKGKHKLRASVRGPKSHNIVRREYRSELEVAELRNSDWHELQTSIPI
jgi:hypothetical protein